MSPRSMIAVLLLAGWAVPAWAGECLKDLTDLDQRLALGVTAPQKAPAAAADAPQAPATVSQLDSVPNTGGVIDRPADQLPPVSGARRTQVTALLEEAKAADAKGDGTVCADRLRQARQLAQQPSDAPSDLH